VLNHYKHHNSFIHLCLCGPLLDLGRFFSFLIYTQSVGLLGQGISPPQSRCLHTGQHKHRINADIHALSGIRTHDPSFRASEDSSYLRQGGHYDRLIIIIHVIITKIVKIYFKLKEENYVMIVSFQFFFSSISFNSPHTIRHRKG
jgi:hypothetical protein